MCITINNNIGNITINGADEKYSKHLEEIFNKKMKEHDKYFIPFISNYLEKLNKQYKLLEYINCRKDITINCYKDKKGNNHYRTKTYNSCKDRFCNLCGWQMAKSNKYNIAYTIRTAKYKQGYHLAMLRLSRKSVPSVPEDVLGQEIKNLNSAFSALVRTKEFKKICDGYIRKLEVTYNNNTNTYNPHLHIVLALNKEYFDNKISWLQAWQKVNNNMAVNANFRFRLNIKGKNLYKLSHYLAKPIIKHYSTAIKQDTFNTLHYILHGQRLLTYSGICKQILKKKRSDNHGN